MRRDTRFTVLLSPTERDDLERLAARLGRTMGDTVRSMLHQALAAGWDALPLPPPPEQD